MSDQQATNFDMQKFLTYRINILAKRMSLELSKIYIEDEFNITIPEWRTLLWTNSNDKVYAKDISHHCLMDKTQVSRVIANLEKRGYITRQVDQEDQRSQLLRVTDTGKQLIEKIVPLAAACEDNMISALSNKEYQQLFSMIDKLEAHIETL